jgi:hypothetical protein
MPKSRHSTMASPTTGPASNHRFVSPTSVPPVGDTGTGRASPIDSTSADIHDERGTDRCVNAAPRNSAMRMPVARIGSTNTTAARPNAAACVRNPPTSERRPSNQRGRLTSRTMSPARSAYSSGTFSASSICSTLLSA